MELVIVILLAIVAWVLLLSISYVSAMAVIYLCQEVNHEIRKAKRTYRNTMWDLEWKFKHR
jgi:hypothetical protein